MDFKLNSVDFLQVGVTSPRTMKLISSSSGRGTQKIAIGDHDGILHCFNVKRGDINYAFKTLPGTKISSLCLGGAVGTVMDKIFVACGNEVRGFNKKGKQFLGFDTNLTETIQEMYVSGNDLMVCGNFVYNHFVDCHDTNYFLAGDKIHDIICLPREKVGALVPILACQDRVLRVLKDSQLLYEVDIAGSPSCLALCYGDGGDESDDVLYGTSNGKIGLITIGPNLFRHDWCTGDEKSHGGINSMDNYDLLGDGVKDLIVGRDDGQVEIYSYVEGNVPKLKYSHTCTESVTTVQGGSVSNSAFREIAVATYSGHIRGMHLTASDALDSPRVYDFNSANCLRAKLQCLQTELEELQLKAISAKDKFQQTVQERGGFSTTVPLDINDKFSLNQNDASYVLSLETVTAIDHVLLQSNVPIDLLDVEKNSAVVSFSKCAPESGNYLLATYRCQANTTRLEVKIRTIEGQYGMLQVYITPRLQPKCCQLRQYHIKPLSLHQRSPSSEQVGPLNSLTLRGPFSFAEIHSWVVFCLPELPERPPTGGAASYVYVSTFLKTRLHCNYSKGEATFKSENLSTISILKDVLTKEATKKKIRLDISCDVNNESIEYTLRQIHPLLEHQFTLSKKVALIEPLKELQLHEGDASFLTSEYEEILRTAKDLLEEYEKQPSYLERLYGMVTDLYIDKFKFKGMNMKSKVPNLLEILDDYDHTKLNNFFQSNT